MIDYQELAHWLELDDSDNEEQGESYVVLLT